MDLRTDLAVEQRELHGDCEGVSYSSEKMGEATVERVEVLDKNGAERLSKPVGKYVTVTMPRLSSAAFLPDEKYEAVSGEIIKMLPREGEVLLIGLGNRNITPDALGPRTAAQIVATRHISGSLERTGILPGLRPTAVLAPGVLGQTGIEIADVIKAVCDRIKPSAVITIDALAARSLSRLGCTVQLCDSGISPGSGVGNDRPAVSRQTLGVPVIAIGVPTVVDGGTLARDLGGQGADGEGMIVTPREIDVMIERASRLLALSVNAALHPSVDPLTLMSVM